MRIALSVSSSSEYCDGGCEFALLDLTADLAALALKRVGVLKEQKRRDPFIDETYYWDDSVQYFSPWTSPASTGNEVEGGSLELAAMLEEHDVEAKGVVTVPENFQVPANQLARVECQQMIVRQDAMAFSAIPEHASFYIQTAEIPLAMLEAAIVRRRAADLSSSPTRSDPQDPKR